MKQTFKNKRQLGLCFALLLLAGLLLGQTAVMQAADNSWQAQYWDNKTLTGDPVVVRNENNINFDWGDGRPDQAVNKDAFSARWKRSVNFAAGTYRFTATMDDGMRVWVDNALIIDSWWDSQVHSMSQDIYLNNGDHQIKVEYYEAGGGAIAKLNWVAIGGTTGTFTQWKGEYFNNTSLFGQPVLVRNDADINFNWGIGAPEWNVVASDNFSARWTRTVNFAPGRYQFTVIADDGARFWANGQLLVDKWLDSNSGTYFAEIDLPGGSVPLQMEYYENVGSAVARLSWIKIGGSVAITNWRGEYFNNKTLSGSPVLTRDDSQVNFNWGTGSPANGTVNSDNFSVRWTRTLSFNNGRYRFTATSDDGVRVWVNNQVVIDGWYDHQPQTFMGEIDLPSGLIPIRVEYYDATGGAQVQLAWTTISNVPQQPQPQPTTVPFPAAGTGTVVSALLNVRTGPGTQYPVLHVLARNQTVNLAGYRSADGNWVRINWNGSGAWVSGRPAYLSTTMNIANMPVWQGTVPNTGGPTTTGPTATVTNVYYLNLRTGPGATYTVIKAVPSGTVVTLLGRSRDLAWANVKLLDGSVGWMSASYLASSTPISSLPLAN